MQHAALAAQIARYRDAFPGPHLDLVCASMAAGNTAGDLWALPQGDGPPLLLLWDRGNNVFYLAGEARAPSARAPRGGGGGPAAPSRTRCGAAPVQGAGAVPVP